MLKQFSRSFIAACFWLMGAQSVTAQTPSASDLQRLQNFFSTVATEQRERTPSTDSPVSDPRNFGLLGRGYDSVRQRDFDSCLNLQVMRIGPAHIHERVVVRLSYVSTTRQLQHELKASFDSSGQIDFLGIAQGSSKFDISYESRAALDYNQRALVATVVVLRSGNQVSGRPGLGADAPAHGAGQLQTFFDDCGSGYISRTTRQARLSVVLTITTQTNRELTQLDQSFHGNMDADLGVFSGSGELQQTFSLLKRTYDESHQLALDYEAEGYFGPVPQKPEDMLQFVLDFPSIVTGCRLTQPNGGQLNCDGSLSNEFFAEVSDLTSKYPGINVDRQTTYGVKLRQELAALDGIENSLEFRRETAPVSGNVQYSYWPKLSSVDWAAASTRLTDLKQRLAAKLEACSAAIDDCAPAPSGDVLTDAGSFRGEWEHRVSSVSSRDTALCNGAWAGTNDRCITTPATGEAFLQILPHLQSGQYAIVILDGVINVRHRYDEGRATLTPLQAAAILDNNKKVQLHLDAVGLGTDIDMTGGDAGRYGRTGIPFRNGGVPTDDAGWCIGWLPNPEHQDRDLVLSIFIPGGGLAEPGLNLGDDPRDWTSSDLKARVWIVDRATIESSSRWRARCETRQ